MDHCLHWCLISTLIFFIISLGFGGWFCFNRSYQTFTCCINAHWHCLVRQVECLDMIDGSGVDSTGFWNISAQLKDNYITHGRIEIHYGVQPCDQIKDIKHYQVGVLSDCMQYVNESSRFQWDHRRVWYYGAIVCIVCLILVITIISGIYVIFCYRVMNQIKKQKQTERRHLLFNL